MFDTTSLCKPRDFSRDTISFGVLKLDVHVVWVFPVQDLPHCDDNVALTSALK